MTIRLEKLKARLLANPKVKADYDALAFVFEIPDGLKKDVRNFQSEGGMYLAFEKFELGHQIE